MSRESARLICRVAKMRLSAKGRAELPRSAFFLRVRAHPREQLVLMMQEAEGGSLVPLNRAPPATAGGSETAHHPLGTASIEIEPPSAPSTRLARSSHDQPRDFPAAMLGGIPQLVLGLHPGP